MRLRRKTRHRNVARVGWVFTFAMAVYNLVPMLRLAGLARGKAARQAPDDPDTRHIAPQLREERHKWW